MTDYGYSRVSTEAQDLQSHLNQLIEQGSDPYFTRGEVISSGKAKRPILEQTLADLREGDRLFITSVDRLGRSAAELYAISDNLKQRGIPLVIGGQEYDPNTLAGSVLFSAFAMVAEIERALIKERTKARLAQMKAQGKTLGRPHALTKRQTTEAMKALDAGISLNRVAKIYQCSRATIKASIERFEEETKFEKDSDFRRQVMAELKNEDTALKRLEAAKTAADKEAQKKAKKAGEEA